MFSRQDLSKVSKFLFQFYLSEKKLKFTYVNFPALFTYIHSLLFPTFTKKLGREYSLVAESFPRQETRTGSIPVTLTSNCKTTMTWT